MDQIYTLRYQPDLKHTLTSAPYLVTSAVLNDEQLAGIVISLLMAFDLDMSLVTQHLEIVRLVGNVEKSINLETLLFPHLTYFSGVLSSRLTTSEKIKSEPSFEPLNQYLALLTGPVSFMIVQFEKISFLEGIHIGCKIFNLDSAKIITRIIDRDTSSRLVETG